MKKIISSLIIAALITNLVFVPAARSFAAEQSRDGTFSVPPVLGTVTSLKNSGSQGFAVNIQDLHCSGEVQKNIAEILKYLNEKYGFDKVYLEGAPSGFVDVSLLSDMLKTEIGRETAAAMLDGGYLNGVEYYAAQNGKKDFIYGVENESLYRENIALLADILNAKPEIELICAELETRLSEVKKNYLTGKINALNKFVKRYKDGKIDAYEFYKYGISKTAEQAENSGAVLYPNIYAYTQAASISKSLSRQKTLKQFSEFAAVLKSVLPYKEFSQLSSESQNFQNIQNISKRLLDLSEQNGIFKNNGFNYVKNYLTFLELSKNINPVELSKEEGQIINKLYENAGADKYQSEMIFLSDFVSEIRGYFTAEITAQDLAVFKDKFKKFRQIWCSYFPENYAKKLDIYAALLEKYHNNNLKRDEIFFSVIKNSDFVKNQNLTVIVTGGFHSAGLEKILSERNRSYAVITPKISGGLERARDVYENIIKASAGAQKSAIAVEPFLNRPLQSSLPELVEKSAQVLMRHKEFSVEQKQAGLENFINDFLEKRKAAGFEGNAEFAVNGYSGKRVKFSASYDGNPAQNYEVINGKLFQGQNKPLSLFAAFDLSRSSEHMLDKFFGIYGSFKYFRDVIVAPLFEEIIFRVMPFALVFNSFFKKDVFYSNTRFIEISESAFIPASISAFVAGAIIFPLLHIAGDVYFSPSGEIRNLRKLISRSLLLASVFFIVSISVFVLTSNFALCGLLAYFVSTWIHALLNKKVFEKKEKGIDDKPLSLFFRREAPKNNPIDPVFAEKIDKAIKAVSAVKMESESQEMTKGKVLKEIAELKQYINAKEISLLDEPIRKLLYLSGGKNDVGTAQILQMYSAVFPLLKFYALENGSLTSGQLKYLHDILNKLHYSAFAEYKETLAVLAKLKIEESEGAGYLMRIGITALEKEPLSQEDYGNIYDIFYNTAQAVHMSTFRVHEIFAIVGFNAETIPKVLRAYKRADPSGYVIDFDEFRNVNYSDKFIDFIVGSDDLINLPLTIKSFLSFNKKSEDVAVKIISRLFDKARDKSLPKSARAAAVFNLAMAYAATFSIKGQGSENLLNLAEINSLMAETGVSSELLPSEIYINFETKNPEHLDKFSYTPLLSKMPDTVIEQNLIKKKSPVLIEKQAGAETSSNKEIYARVAGLFERLQNILKYNSQSLEILTNLSQNPSRREVVLLLNSVEKMISELEYINHLDFSDFMVSLENIRKSNFISALTFDQITALESWRSRPFTEIKTLHTLINAVHQTAIEDFKEEIIARTSRNEELASRSINFYFDDFKLTGYNLSENGGINQEIKDLFLKLILSGIDINDFIFKDDILVWSSKLNLHSVDIIFNFGQTDGGISIYYTENGKEQYERLRYFIEVLKSLNFNISSSKNGTAVTINAKLDKNLGLNEQVSFNDTAFKVIQMFKYSNNLDISLRDKLRDSKNRTEYDSNFFRLIKKFAAGKIWYRYAITKEDDKDLIFAMPPVPNFKTVAKIIDPVLNHCGLKGIPVYMYKQDIDQASIDKYINEPLEQAYIEGRIVYDKNGKLVPSANFNLNSDEIFNNEEDAIMQAEILNSAGDANVKRSFYGSAGSFELAGAVMRIGQDYIYIKTLLDPSDLTYKYASCLLVSGQERKKLDARGLYALLNENGYKVSLPEKLSKREISATRARLGQVSFSLETPEIYAAPASFKNDYYVSGKLVFDKYSITQDSIFVSENISPEDVGAAESAKGVITLNGSALSHAAITLAEWGKAYAVLSTGLLKDDTISTTAYKKTGEVEVNATFSLEKKENYETTLSYGDRILLNGQTGSILFFGDLPQANLDEVQEYIDSGNIAYVKEFIRTESKNESIGSYIEYVYFQSAGNEKLQNIIAALLESDMPKKVRDKVKSLNLRYEKSQAEALENVVDNLSKIENPLIAFSEAKNLENRIGLFLSYASSEETRALGEKSRIVIDRARNAFLKAAYKALEEASMIISQGELSIADSQILSKLPSYSSAIKENESQSALALKNRLEDAYAKIKDNIALETEKKRVSFDSEIVGFSQISAKDAGRFGSKTAELAQMSRLFKDSKNVIVPQGIGISGNVLELYFASVGKLEEYKKISQVFENAVKSKKFKAAHAAGEDLRNLISESANAKNRMNLEVANTFMGGIFKLYLPKDKKYAVRSSGIGEDGMNNAYAGMGETFLNVAYDDIFKNVAQVWEAFYSQRSIGYMIETGQIIKPAVLVQEMVSDVSKAGVVFGRDENSNRRIAAVYGLGEGLASGVLTPDEAEVDANTGEIINYKTADKKIKVVPNINGGVKTETVTEGQRERVLHSSEIKLINGAVTVLEEDSGYSLDVEYAIDKNGRLFILQRRPLTVLNASEAKREKAKPADFNIVLSQGAAKNQNPLLYVLNPKTKDDPMPVYFKGFDKKNKTIIFAVENSFDLALKVEILNLIKERLSDENVIKKLKISAFDSNIDKNSVFEIDPLYGDFSAPSRIPSRPSLPSSNAVLQAA